MPIKTVINKGRVPVKIWTDEVESESIDQLVQVSNLPFIFRHVAAMPDVHLGKGTSVGSVVPTDGAIVPNLVGVDIGCGMAAMKLKLDPDRLLANAAEIRHSIERSIPVGREVNRDISDSVKKRFDKIGDVDFSQHDTPKELKGLHDQLTQSYQGSTYQMGSLGGGNHFIELCLDKDRNVWATLHSGSRNVGKTAADYFVKLAQSLCRQWQIPLPHPDLAYLPADSKEGKQYFEMVSWCQKYAFENREEMLHRILKDLSFAVNDKESVEVLFKVNCHHNYVEMENHFGRNIFLTRKGAIRARETDYGIIPGSMGTSSFIVKGKGNPESFTSCSHGAGRKMSRTRAKELFTLKDVEEQTEGIECRKDEGIIDELPGAYKDIYGVMENQEDLVESIAELEQFICIKG